jgi:hypothetical protein
VARINTTILALDLGKYKSVACLYDTMSGEVLLADPDCHNPKHPGATEVR